MKTVRVTIDPAVSASIRQGRIDLARVDATTEDEIALQQVVDEAEAVQDAAKSDRRGSHAAFSKR